MMMTPRLGHGSGCVQALSSRTGLHTWCARTWAFGLSGSVSRTVEPCICGSGESGGRPYASPMGILPSYAHADVGFIWLIARRNAPPWEQLQCPSNSSGGSNLLERLLGRGFRSPIWQRCVVRQQAQICAVCSVSDMRMQDQDIGLVRYAH